MNESRTLQVLTNEKGRIIGAGFVGTGTTDATEVQLRIAPLKGQSLLEVPIPKELKKLETEEDFRRFTAEFHVVRGKKTLTLKHTGKGRKKERKGR